MYIYTSGVSFCLDNITFRCEVCDLLRAECIARLSDAYNADAAENTRNVDRVVFRFNSPLQT